MVIPGRKKTTEVKDKNSSNENFNGMGQQKDEDQKQYPKNAPKEFTQIICPSRCCKEKGRLFRG